MSNVGNSPIISFANLWNSGMSLYFHSVTWLPSNIWSSVSFIIVYHILPCVIIKKTWSWSSWVIWLQNAKLSIDNALPTVTTQINVEIYLVTLIDHNNFPLLLSPTVKFQQTKQTWTGAISHEPKEKTHTCWFYASKSSQNDLLHCFIFKMMPPCNILNKIYFFFYSSCFNSFPSLLKFLFSTKSQDGA